MLHTRTSPKKWLAYKQEFVNCRLKTEWDYYIGIKNDHAYSTIKILRIQKCLNHITRFSHLGPH